MEGNLPRQVSVAGRVVRGRQLMGMRDEGYGHMVVAGIIEENLAPLTEVWEEWLQGCMTAEVEICRRGKFGRTRRCCLPITRTLGVRMSIYFHNQITIVTIVPSLICQSSASHNKLVPCMDKF